MLCINIFLYYKVLRYDTFDLVFVMGQDFKAFVTQICSITYMSKSCYYFSQSLKIINQITFHIERHMRCDLKRHRHPETHFSVTILK